MILVTLPFRVSQVVLKGPGYGSQRPAPYFLLIGFMLFLVHSGHGQDQWIDFIKEKDSTVMTVSLDLKHYNQRPNYKNLLIVGTGFAPCMKNGMPEADALEQVYTFSDSMARVIDRVTKKELVGILTYRCLAFDIYYVRDTVDLRDSIASSLVKNFHRSQNYLSIKRDRNWNYYFNYLLPPNLTEDELIDQKYLYDLVLQGDDLKGLRKVKHWIYFNKLERRTKMSDRLTRLKFEMDSINYVKDRAYPYELQFSRMDSINPSTISNLTTMLKILCESYKAEYDGWGTELKVDD